MNNIISLETLPIDSLQLIKSFMNNSSKLNFRQVNKQCQSIINNQIILDAFKSCESKYQEDIKNIDSYSEQLQSLRDYASKHGWCKNLCQQQMFLRKAITETTEIIKDNQVRFLELQNLVKKYK